MSKKNQPDLIRIVLSPEQQQKVRTATGREVEAIELTVQELEPRIAPNAPRLASNHNETPLTV
jgi:hypothetical protein